MDFSPNPLYLPQRYRRRSRNSVNGLAACRFESFALNREDQNREPKVSVIREYAVLWVPYEVAQNALLSLRLEIHVHAAARASHRIRTSARRDVEPRITGIATEAPKKLAKGRNDRLEILPSKIGPLIITHGFIYGPLLHVDRAIACGEQLFPVKSRVLLRAVPPRLRRIGSFPT